MIRNFLLTTLAVCLALPLLVVVAPFALAAMLLGRRHEPDALPEPGEGLVLTWRDRVAVVVLTRRRVGRWQWVRSVN